eukprot:CAMPEP_0181233160 /NCGR_PEP_ID=MMETSP1096-20121128/36173_1 /TAXON_ID=156174 ORGANISM="Chrysochromulina ericina, Strain CCMP281" /NCGR_SAMPLE_ID=MMETSP1096 /ASSEMBLY_ACC=CAM_ASM_000453 /LENGTH=30 /DNA_ID= /DNA_START= /DNA_END= /DNA_ORIENTATION=
MAFVGATVPCVSHGGWASSDEHDGRELNGL